MLMKAYHAMDSDGDSDLWNCLGRCWILGLDSMVQPRALVMQQPLSVTGLELASPVLHAAILDNSLLANSWLERFFHCVRSSFQLPGMTGRTGGAANHGITAFPGS